MFADDARRFILSAGEAHAAYLPSNLEAVELTLALYSVFSSPPDVVVWDAGHQTYTHKLVTGRAERFGTVRQPGGLAGFPRPDESEHDAFGTGHAGTGLSAALGMALARDLKGSEEAVVAVVDTAALACGLSLEALNHFGSCGTSLTLVLNDTHPGLSTSSGALGHALSTGGAKDFFGELGLAYIGPVDGHDLGALQSAFTSARSRSGGVVVHVQTTQGADDDAGAIWEPLMGSCSHRVAQSLARLMEHDPRVVAVTSGMDAAARLASLAQRFPERVVHVGRSEQHAVTLCAGLAARGFKPYCCIPSSLLQRAYDQILHDVCLQKWPVRFLVGSAQLSEDGPTHHGTFDMAFLAQMPDLVVAAPSSTDALQQTVEWSHGYLKGPVAIRYPDVLPESLAARIEPFRAQEVRSGSCEVTYLAVGSCVEPCLAAATHLEALGIEACVVDLTWVKPLDEPLVAKYASRSKTLVVVEEGVATGGVGQRVQACVTEHGLTCDVRLHNTGDTLRKWGPVDYLRKQCGLGVASLVESGL